MSEAKEPKGLPVTKEHVTTTGECPVCFRRLGQEHARHCIVAGLFALADARAEARRARGGAG